MSNLPIGRATRLGASFKGELSTDEITIKKKAGVVLALAVVASAVIATSEPALTGQPPGQQGHQEQPDNQGGASGQPGGPSVNQRYP